MQLPIVVVVRGVRYEGIEMASGRIALLGAPKRMRMSVREL